MDGFWSITIYNAKGFLEPNKYDAYALNNLTAVKAADGSVIVRVGTQERSRHDAEAVRAVEPVSVLALATCPIVS